MVYVYYVVYGRPPIPTQWKCWNLKRSCPRWKIWCTWGVGKAKTIFRWWSMRILFPTLAGGLGRFQTSCPLGKQYDQANTPPLFLFWKYVNLLQISMNQILVSKSHCELECLGAKRYRLWRQNLSSLSRKDEVFYLFLIFSLREVMKKYGIFVNFFLYKGVG